MKNGNYDLMMMKKNNCETALIINATFYAITMTNENLVSSSTSHERDLDHFIHNCRSSDMRRSSSTWVSR